MKLRVRRVPESDVNKASRGPRPNCSTLPYGAAAASAEPQRAGQLDEQALVSAVTAAVRHKHTEYDELLAAGWDRALARQQVADQVQAILAAWKK